MYIYTHIFFNKKIILIKLFVNVKMESDYSSKSTECQHSGVKFQKFFSGDVETTYILNCLKYRYMYSVDKYKTIG